MDIVFTLIYAWISLYVLYLFYRLVIAVERIVSCRKRIDLISRRGERHG